MEQIIKRPFITEKSMALAGKGWYAFVVEIKAHKRQIARAISSLYKVTVKEIRIIRVHGKTRRVGRLMRPAVKSDWKKALVKLVAGQTIPEFGATEGEKK